MSPTTIVLGDDHTVVRQGLRRLLEAEPDFSILGECADGLGVVSMVERVKPNVLILDLIMPGLGGLEVTRQVGRYSPQTRTVILSMHSSEAYVMEALKNGAAAYVLKESSGEELVQAVREVVAGRRYLSPPLSERVIDTYLQKAENITPDRYESLSARERQVFHLTAEGRTNVEIADRLCISPRTVEAHRAHLMRKLGMRNHTELVRYAIRRGVLSLEG